MADIPGDVGVVSLGGVVSGRQGVVADSEAGAGGEELQSELCDLCGAAISVRGMYYAFVPDSSAIYLHDPKMDGRRMVMTCSADHLERLVEEYKRKPFVEAELWAGKVARPMFWHAGEADERELAAETGLSPEQIDQA